MTLRFLAGYQGEEVPLPVGKKAAKWKQREGLEDGTPLALNQVGGGGMSQGL